MRQVAARPRELPLPRLTQRLFPVMQCEWMEPEAVSSN